MALLQRLLIAVSLCLSSVVWSADIVRDINVGREDVERRGGYLEAGLSLEYQSLGRLYESEDGDHDDREGAMLNLAGGFAYYRKPFFIEASTGSFDGLNIGFNVHQGERWSVDVLAASIFGNVSIDTGAEDEQPLSELSEEQRDRYLLTRDTLYSGAGIRATMYLDDYVTQFRLVSDIYDDAGFTGTVRLGRSWLYRNWNVHSIVSAEYNSSSTNNYLYGVSEEEATTRFPEFSSSGGFSYAAEVGASYPVSRNLIYRSFVRVRRLPNEISESPFVVQSYDAQVFSALLYVF